MIPNSIVTNLQPQDMEVIYTHKITIPSVVGQALYYIPIGDYFLDAAGESRLEVDMGGGFVDVPYPAGYTHFVRTASGAPGALTVLDMAMGFRYIAGLVAAGWTFRFTWLQRYILKTPAALAKIRLTGVGGTLDLANNWSMNGLTPTNGFTVPELSYPGASISVEVWRRIERPGGLNTGPTQRRGPRYYPYYRGPVGRFNIHESEVASSGITRHSRKFRVCYYNTVTGARSALSPDIVVVCNASGNQDRSGQVGGPSFPTRGNYTVWIASG